MTADLFTGTHTLAANEVARPRCTAFEEWRGQDTREPWQRTLDEIAGRVA